MPCLANCGLRPSLARRAQGGVRTPNVSVRFPFRGSENRKWVFKLGYKDSNLEMLESESSALPFGDSPITTTSDIIHESQKKSF